MSATTLKPGVTHYTMPSDTQVAVVRVVKAPRKLVFATYTEPRHLQRWLLGPAGWSMPVCEFEARSGGRWRFVWRKANGTEMAMAGDVRECVPPSKIVTTESWGPEWPETINTTEFTESDGHTTITLTITYPSKEARDKALETGMKGGMDESFARLEALLAQL